VVPDMDTADVGSVQTPTVDDLAEIMPVSWECSIFFALQSPIDGLL
jgi:hypothetical protein